MLEDRDYMRQGRRGIRDDMGTSGMRCLFILLLLNVLVFIVGSRDVLEQLVLPTNVFSTFELWRFVTAAFVHGDFYHLFFNMFGLFIFGSLAAPNLGWKKFLSLYMVAALAGNLLWLVCNINRTVLFQGVEQHLVVLGASGAVIGVTMATAMMMPNVEVILLFFPVPIKLKTMAIVYIVIEVIQQQTMDSGIAYLAHIGGFIGAFLFMELFARQYISWHPLAFLKRRRKGSSPPPRVDEYRKSSSAPPGWTVSSYDAYTSSPASKRDIDRVLDKLSKNGINSLTEQEMDVLRKAREQMKNGQNSR